MAKSIASASVIIDPANCSSAVSYRIYESYNTLRGEVSLSDCNRKIEWNFDEDTSDVDKLDAAIGSLMEFRRTYIKAKRDFAREKSATTKST